MSREPRVGIWFIGALGGIATCTAAGIHALRRGAGDAIGIATERPECLALGLAPLRDMVFGGWDIRRVTPLEAAREMHRRAGIPTHDTLEAVAADLNAFGAAIRPGIVLNCGAAIDALRDAGVPAEDLPLTRVVERLQSDLNNFRVEHALDDVVVVNVASTEPLMPSRYVYTDLEKFRRALRNDERGQIESSVLYAYAAIDAGYPYVNFTPSHGASVSAILQLAEEKRVPHAGRDGKTGETLLKTVLAPMFAARRLRVLSWSGFNILGNRDGMVLNTPENNQAKVRNKDEVIHGILDQEEKARSLTRIDYVESLDDWKTAWDFIHFQGFLGAKMSLQFTWQGCDSALAAPLVIDLARWTEYAKRQGDYGVLPHLAMYFKSPQGTDEQDFFEQQRLLRKYIRHHAQTQRLRES